MEKSRYTVGWIAALNIELTAAIQMLDEQHDPPADHIPQSTDTNVYVFGKIGDHNVIIAFLEAGAYGIVAAATTTTNLFRSFPSITMCLLVGIGAGIRRKGFDVRLGDVVISQPDGKSGGVYQYDLQKARPDGQLEKIGILNRPSALLLKILKRVQAHHDAHPSKVPEHTKRITPKMESSKPGYVHQGLENDRLFKSTFSHVSEPSAVDHEDLDFDDSDTEEPSKTCPHCPSKERVKRRDRPSGTDPQFHYGTIASGNTLVKDASARNKIVAQVPGHCICFEMEAAGMMNSFPCLVIRGICDYADSHKNDRWQPYAALTAAAYAREFLEIAPRGDVETGQPLVEQLDDIARTIHSIQNTTTETKATLEVEKVEKWLSAFDPSGNYNIAIDERNKGLSDSGKWLLKNQKFLEWKNTRSSFLWLHGLAGCGKTILCSIAIEHLKSEVDRIVLYFYFAFNDQRTRSKGSLLRSLIMQLSRYDERAMKKLVEQNKENKDEQPSDEDLGKIFISMAVLVTKQVTIVLDGLDELERKEETRRDVLLWIKETNSIDAADIRILASSRREMDIEMELKAIGPAFELTTKTVEEDIKAFVHKHIHYESSRLRRWRNHPDAQKLIEDTLTKKADGMFRWVACQIQAIQDCLDFKSLRERLSSLPKTLDETYDRIIDDLWETQQWKAIKLLQFLAFAERPLELFEAIDLIAVDLTETPSFHPINRMPDPREIVEVCSSLVLLDSHDADRERLQLAHFSVKEYLISGRMGPNLLEHFDEIPAHSSILNICLRYLESVLPSVTSIIDIKGPTQAWEETDWERDLSDFPLMEYAIDTWPVHARRCCQHIGSAVQIQKFLNHESCLKWLFCFNKQPLPVQVDERERLQVSCPVLLSIHLGLQGMALEMINTGFKFETEVISEQVLCRLVNGKYLTVTQYWMKQHDMKYATGDGRYCMTSHLYLATAKGMSDVVTALVERGVDIHEEGGELGTALNVACKHGSDDITATLLQRSKDSVSQECHEQYIQGALKTIVGDWQNFNPRVRDQLVESCLALDNPGSSLDYCLKTVFFDGNLDLAERLVRKGAHVDVVAQYGTELLFSIDDDRLLSFLHLFSGEDSGNVDPDALQKLFMAECRGKTSTMIHKAIERGFNKVLSFMCAHGVDREGYISFDQLLSTTTGQCTNLFKVVEQCNTAAVQILLNVSRKAPYQHGFEDYIPSQKYINERIGLNKETCLHVAARLGCIEIMRALISCNAALEIKDINSRTPLHHACRENFLEAVKLLVEHGANLQALDINGKTPLQLAREFQDRYHVSRKAVIEWLEQRTSQISNDDGFSPKGETNEADNGESFSIGRDSKRQRTV